MNVGSLVALATAADFTGAVERVDGAVFTVQFAVPVGRGWLRAEDLIEIPAQKGTKMDKDDSVILKEFPNVSGKVLSIDGKDATIQYDDGTGVDTKPIAELARVVDVELPDDKSWPPPTLETKDSTT